MGDYEERFEPHDEDFEFEFEFDEDEIPDDLIFWGFEI